MALARYIDVIASSNMVEENLGCICLKWATSDEMNYIVCAKELKDGIMNVG